jgi:hypothetical protein
LGGSRSGGGELTLAMSCIVLWRTIGVGEDAGSFMILRKLVRRHVMPSGSIECIP